MDLEFCDHCNREIGSGRQLDTLACSEVSLSSGNLINLSVWGGVWPSDPEVRVITAEKRRIYGFSPSSWNEYQATVLTRSQLKLSCLPAVEVIELENGAVIVSEPLGPDSDCPSPFDNSMEGLKNPANLILQCEEFAMAMSELHDSGFVWLNFQPSALMHNKNGTKITNLDTGVFAIGTCPSRMVVSSQWSAPETQAFDARLISPATDVYHLGLYAYYALAGLLESGFPGQGPASFGFAFPPLRVYAPQLVAGIAPTIERAIQRRAGSRFAGPGEFVEAFRSSLEEVRQRSISTVNATAQSTGFVRRILNRVCPSVFRSSSEINSGVASRTLECGCVTVAGLAKSSAGVLNQDIAETCVLYCQGRPVSVMVVADGVSTATIGSGDTASRIACDAIHSYIADSLNSTQQTADWNAILKNACLEASRKILDAATAMSPFPEDLTDSGVMSTTAVITIVDGNRVMIANVGDSRVYVVGNDRVEQLTVDGDTGTALLSKGVSPEEVQASGETAKSLQFCLGSCHLSETGELLLNPTRSLPAIFEFTLLEGDTVILCTDGLVEEGVFLEPTDLPRLLKENSLLSAQYMAEKLVAEADLKQRVVSESEPRGFGDNISCVLFRFASLTPDA